MSKQNKDPQLQNYLRDADLRMRSEIAHSDAIRRMDRSRQPNRSGNWQTPAVLLAAGALTVGAVLGLKPALKTGQEHLGPIGGNQSVEIQGGTAGVYGESHFVAKDDLNAQQAEQLKQETGGEQTP